MGPGRVGDCALLSWMVSASSLQARCTRPRTGRAHAARNPGMGWSAKRSAACSTGRATHQVVLGDQVVQRATGRPCLPKRRSYLAKRHATCHAAACLLTRPLLRHRLVQFVEIAASLFHGTQAVGAAAVFQKCSGLSHRLLPFRHGIECDLQRIGARFACRFGLGHHVHHALVIARDDLHEVALQRVELVQQLDAARLACARRASIRLRIDRSRRREARDRRTMSRLQLAASVPNLSYTYATPPDMPAAKFGPTSPKMSATPPVILLAAVAAHASTTTVAPELRTAKRCRTGR